MTDLYTEEQAKTISKRKENIEKIRYNKKASARRKAEDLSFFNEVKRLASGLVDLEHLDYE